MRTHQDILKDFMDYCFKNTDKPIYDYNKLLELEEEEKTILEGRMWKKLLSLCYKEDGMLWFTKFILGDMMYAGYPEPIKYNNLWLTWNGLLRLGDHIGILCPRQHGKCESENSLITLADGTRKKIKDMKTGEEIISINKELKNEKDVVVMKKFVGRKKEYTVILDSGKKIKLANTHRLLTTTGWNELSTIKIGDYIATPRTIQVETKQTISHEQAKILGWLISEGNFDGSITISNCDKLVLNSIEKNCKKLKIHSKKYDNYIRISANFGFHELKKIISYNKYIPEEIFKQPKEIKYSFLSSLIEGDGYLDCRKNKGDNSIIYCSSSKRLIRDLQHLLLTLGIKSRFKKRTSKYVLKNKSNAFHYLLYITSKDCLKLLKNLNFVSKNNQRDFLIKQLEKIKFNTKKDIIPQELIKKYWKGVIYNNWSREVLNQKIKKFENFSERNSYKEIHNKYEINDLKNLSTSDIYWDKIVDIIEGDYVNMYDIQIKKNHNYISDDIYSHNSSYYSVILSIYRMAIYKNYNILVESASEDQANGILSHIKKIIESNEFLLQKRDKNARWSTGDMEYNGGMLLARGVGSEVRGGTYDLIICDDILRSDNKLTDKDIEDFIDEELEPMIMVRKGQLIIVGTRKSFTDIFSTLEERIKEGSTWKIYVYKAIIDYDKQIILCPERFTFKELIQKRATMGIRKFNKEYQNEVSGSGTGLFDEEIIKVAKQTGKAYYVSPKAVAGDELKWTYVIGVDTARAGTASADFTVVTVLAYDPDKQYKRICWMWRKKGLKISEQVKQIANLAKLYGYPIILVEKNNVGQEFVDEMVDRYNLAVETFTTTKTSKEDLLRLLVTNFENEKIIIPQGDERSKEQMEPLLEELSKFVVEITRAGNEVMKGSGSSHDDTIISLSLAVKCTQAYSTQPMAVSIDKPKRMSELEYYTVTNDGDTLLRL